MTKKSYLPSNALALQNFLKNLRSQLSANRARWEISEQEVSALDTFLTAFYAAVEISENPQTRTSAAIKKRNEARAALLEVLRPFIQGRLEYNKRVTDDDLLAMALPVHDHKPSPTPDPTEEPETTVSMPSPGVVEIHFRRKDETGRGKPQGMHGAELRRLLSQTPPVDWSELQDSEFATRSPFRLTFEGHDRGKWLHYAVRWENNRGKKGPWTDIASCVIP